MKRPQCPVADDHAPLLERELHVCQLLVLHLEEVVRVVVALLVHHLGVLLQPNRRQKVAHRAWFTLFTLVSVLHATLDSFDHCLPSVRGETLIPSHPAKLYNLAGTPVMFSASVTASSAFSSSSSSTNCTAAQPPVWPTTFTLVQRRIPDDPTAGNATTVTYYDFEHGANLIQITSDDDPAAVLWDLELNSHHSYYFTPSERSCQKMRFPVGILRPDWLANATFLGKSVRNGRPVLGWTKVDFIDYYADAESCEPVSWYFHSMQARFDTIYWGAHVAVADLAMFEPPSYCNATVEAQ